MHMFEMRAAWGEERARVDKLESKHANIEKEMSEVKGRTAAVELKVQEQSMNQGRHERKLDEIAEDLAKLKVEVGERAVPAGNHREPRAQEDPWASYLNSRQREGKKMYAGNPVARHGGDGGQTEDGGLTEDEKRTLILGGWAQDTKKSVIETESKVLLGRPELQGLLDVEQAAVYGPRRSVGSLKFEFRANEDFKAVRERMWGVVKGLRDMGEVMPSAKGDLRDHRKYRGDVDTDLAKPLGERHPGAASLRGARRRAGRFSQWNLGGQPVDTLEVVLHDSDFVAVQEVARGEPGWDELNDDHFHWVLHRHGEQYRGVGIGIAQDLLDSVVDKIASPRGIWVLARIKGIGGVVFGSIHCHTGATQQTYANAVQQFFYGLKRKWRQYPIVLGADVNEQPGWHEAEEGHAEVINANVNLSAFLEEATREGIVPVVPAPSLRQSPTHFPRDATREGRQIDMILGKSMTMSNVHFRPELRHCIGTDHAELHVDIYTSISRFQAWGQDTRPRRLASLLPDHEIIVDEEDLRKLARECTAPRASPVYRDSQEIKDMIHQARVNNDKDGWKQVHKMRKKAKRRWQQERTERVVHGDWSAFRSYKRDRTRKKGWWGRMLQDKSAVELTTQVQQHLQDKMTNPADETWPERLGNFIQAVPRPKTWRPYSKEEVFECLSHMRPHTAVGLDMVCVDLLKAIVLHDTLGEQLVDLINHIIFHNEQPADWSTSVLALLAKCPSPAAPGDLRPICVGSNFEKLANRLIMGRVFPALRRGSRISTCGKGRQVADLIGAITRLRDMAHEWREPLLIAKLDVAGAFDRLSRDEVARMVVARTSNTNLGVEVQFLLRQLDVNTLRGTVPGGHEISVHANVGIRQGAPDSAELFGLVMGMLLDDMLEGGPWKQVGFAFEDLPVDLLFFQDDVFVFETTAARLARKIEIIGGALGQGGLKLAMNKTKVIASPDYKGKMVIRVEGQDVHITKGSSIRVLGVSFDLGGPPSQQAEELLGRARAAYSEHRPLLVAKSSWKQKAYIISMLITSTWRWSAGCVHWSKESLAKANSLQAQIFRTAFKLGREKGENWVDWNTRTLRLVRGYLHRHQIERWSTLALRLQHQLLGHWARHTETIREGWESIEGVTMRQIAAVAGNDWPVKAQVLSVRVTFDQRIALTALIDTTCLMHHAYMFLETPMTSSSWRGTIAAYLVHDMDCYNAVPSHAIWTTSTSSTTSTTSTPGEIFLHVGEHAWVIGNDSTTSSTSSVVSYYFAPVHEAHLWETNWDGNQEPWPTWDGGDVDTDENLEPSQAAPAQSQDHDEPVPTQMDLGEEDTTENNPDLNMTATVLANPQGDAEADYVDPLPAFMQDDDYVMNYVRAIEEAHARLRAEQEGRQDLGGHTVEDPGRDANTVGGTSMVQPMVDTPSSSSSHMPSPSHSWEHAQPSSSSSTSVPGTSSSTTAPRPQDAAQEGWIRRGGKWRKGLDRWHHQDGTLRRPRTMHNASTYHPDNVWPLGWEGETPSTTSPHHVAPSGNNTLTADSEVETSRAGQDEQEAEDPLVSWARMQTPSCSSPSSSRTSRTGRGRGRPGSHTPSSSSEDGGTESEASMDDSSCSGVNASSNASTSTGDEAPVGFWSHGTWVPRPRTAQELRTHMGGQGARRLARREARMKLWKEGKWLPSWLQRYKDERLLRNRLREASAIPEDEEVHVVQEGENVKYSEEDGVGPATTSQAEEQHEDDEVLPQQAQPGVTTEDGAQPANDHPNLETTVDEATCQPAQVLPWGDMDGHEGDVHVDSVTTATEEEGWGEQSWGDGWQEWNAWGSWRWWSSPWKWTADEWQWDTASTSSSTTTSTTWMDEVSNMQLTNNERANLEQLRMSPVLAGRFEQLFDVLHEHQVQERGPEARWALQCVLRRAEQAEEAFELMLNVIARRLQPRGVLPITRTPGTDNQMRNLYSWAQNFATVMLHTMEEILRRPLFDHDFEPEFTGQASSSSSVRAARNESHEPTGSERDRSPATSGPLGDLTAASASSSLPAGATPGELLGIWREPETDDGGEMHAALDTQTTAQYLDDNHAVPLLIPVVYHAELLVSVDVDMAVRWDDFFHDNYHDEVAIEELQLWMVREDSERPWNAATQEHLLWHVISNGANGATGDDVGLHIPQAAHVILQPDLPDRENLRRQLPGQSVRQVVGYRRRAWRQHANWVMRGRHGEPVDIPVNGQHLFLIQTNSTVATNNVPAGAAVPPDPHMDQLRFGLM
ncbi:unnamed protein product, partial [Symbiodinium sp. CCMP2456]